MFKKDKNWGLSFSLIEIIVVLFLISFLSGLIILVLKPGVFFQRARDTKRVSDLAKIEAIFNSKKFSDLSFSETKYLDPRIIYISLPDSSSTCGSWISDLPSLPSGWSYRCSATPTNMDGTGWIPVDFKGISSENFLPVDPINKPPYYYTFVVGGSYEVEARLESNFSASINDKGDASLFYEKGSFYLTPPEARNKPRFYQEDVNKILNLLGCQTCNNGLVSYWTFNEASGTFVYDVSGNGHTGELINFDFNTTSGWTIGKIESGLLFDWNNDYVNCLISSQFPSGSSSRTITAWIKPFNYFARGSFLNHIFHYGPSSYFYNRAFGLAVYNDAKFGAHELGIYTRYGEIPLNKWSFLAITLSNNTIKRYYQNGNLIAVYTTDPAPNTSLDVCRIGSRSYLGEYFYGIIDEIRVYNRALSDFEIKALYEATK